MCTSEPIARSTMVWLSVLAFLGGCAAVSDAPRRYGLGSALTERELAGWDIDVRPDGAGLPPGSGTSKQGAPIYAAQCASCHGAKGEGGIAMRLTGNKASLSTPNPQKTIGSYWPYATTVFDYIRRTMPHHAPQSLSPKEVYALTAHVLHLNGIVDELSVIDAASLPKVQMPNRNGFKAVVD